MNIRFKYFQTITLSFLLLFFGPFSADAVSPDLTSMGRLLTFSRTSLEFIDNAISNLTRNEDNTVTIFARDIKKEYQKAIKLDFFAQLWYLQGNYSRTYKNLNQSLNVLQKIYRRILVNYVDETWILLEESAPIIVRTHDKNAYHLLQLGYRDLESSRLYYQRGNNIRPTLHANQLAFYREGIKRIRRTRRYAILALVEARIPRSEKPQYQVVTLNAMKRSKSELEIKQTDYERVLNLLVNLMGRQLIPRRIKRPLVRELSLDGKPRVIQLLLTDVHQDNYNRLIVTRRSIRFELVAQLNTVEMNSKRILPKRNRGNRYVIPRSDSGPDEKFIKNYNLPDKKKPQPGN